MLKLACCLMQTHPCPTYRAVVVYPPGMFRLVLGL